MKILITGIAGMAGSHLADFLLSKRDCKIYGIIRGETDNINHILNQMTVFKADLTDRKAVESCLNEIRPDVIYHLASQSFVQESWNNPVAAFTDNVVSQINLIESSLHLKMDPVFLITSSSEVYGQVKQYDIPIRETHELRPASPYAVSKITQEYMAKQYFYSHQVKTIVMRPFNHTGPRRNERFVESSFAKQFVEMELGLRKHELQVGNLEAQRDFTDVRDVVRAYCKVVQKELYGDTFQVASNKTITMYQIINLLKEITGIDPVITQDPSRMRPSDIPILQGSYDKINRFTGWEPMIPFEYTLRDLVDYWRTKLEIRVEV